MDQAVFDVFYPNDVVIEFQDSAAVVLNQQNFNVIQRSDGRVLQLNSLFTSGSGSGITVNGVQVTITGSPQEGNSLHVDSSPTLDVLTNVKSLA